VICYLSPRKRNYDTFLVYSKREFEITRSSFTTKTLFNERSTTLSLKWPRFDLATLEI